MESKAETKPVSEYGEPWKYCEDEQFIFDRDGDRVMDTMVSDCGPNLASRAVACVNCLAGIPNPEAWVADVRDLLWELKFYDEHADGSTLGFNWGIIQKRLAALSAHWPPGKDAPAGMISEAEREAGKRAWAVWIRDNRDVIDAVIDAAVEYIDDQ